MEGVAYYTEVVEGNALLKFNDKQCVATIKGVSSEFENMSGFDSVVSDGKFDISQNNIVLGKGISFLLQANPNDVFSPISMYAPKRGIVNSLNPEDGLNELKVYAAGAFTISDEFDKKYVIMNIVKARELLSYSKEVTSIELGFKKGDDYQKIQGAALSKKQQETINAWVKKKVAGNFVHLADDFKNCTFSNKWIN